MLEYTLIQSKRKTISISVTPQGEVLVRAPQNASKRNINRFVESHQEWIDKQRNKMADQRAVAHQAGGVLSTEEIHALADQALQVIPKKVAYYAPIVGVDYGRITIRNQRTRWGSCSAKGNLNFNCLLMLMPEQVIDAVVVHELCHRLEMNHSKRFYAEVLRVYPEYHKWNQWLKENGGAIMARMP